MKRFIFRFETVSTVKKGLEEKKLQALAVVQRKFQAEISVKEGLIRSLDEALVRRENLGSSPISVQAFFLEDSFILGTKQRIIQQDQRIFRTRKNLDRAIFEYLTARKNRKVFDQIKERDHRSYLENEKKREQRTLDDLYTMRHRMKKGAA